METVQFSSRVQSHRSDKRARLRLLEVIKCSLYSDSRYSWHNSARLGMGSALHIVKSVLQAAIKHLTMSNNLD